MTSERFANYQFDMSAVQLPESGKWAPFLEIRIESGTRDEVIFPKQRIAEEDVFDSEDAAIEEARRFAKNHVSSGEF